jgi:energy-coupling factor transporter ATP-binding protein EcfA2
VLKLAAGLLEPTSGSIRRHAAPGARAVGLALEFPERQLFGRTVSEDVTVALWVQGVSATERRERARIALTAVGLDPGSFEQRIPSTLSEGEKRRVALAGILAEAPRAVLLDEPTAGLDSEGRRSLAASLRRLALEGRAMLFASHDLDFVSGVADRVIVLGRDAAGPGGVLGTGPPGAFWRNAPLLARASLPVPDALLIEALLRERGLIQEAGSAGVCDADSILSKLARALGSGVRPTPGEVAVASEGPSAPE